MKLTISEASEFLGVSIPTLRRWEKEGRILSERTEGNHRRYDKNMLMSLKNKKGKVKRDLSGLQPCFCSGSLVQYHCLPVSA